MKKIFLSSVFVFLVAFILFEGRLKSQDLSEVTCELDKKQILSDLPFDIPFLLKINSEKVLTKVEIYVEDRDAKIPKSKVVSLEPKKGVTEVKLPPGTPVLITPEKSTTKVELKVEYLDQKKLGSKVGFWESKEGATGFKVRMSPLKPLKRYEFTFIYEVKLSPEKVKDVKSKISDKIDPIIKKNLTQPKEKIDWTKLVKEILEEIPDTLPPDIDGIKLTPKKGSLFERGELGKQKRDTIYEKKNDEIVRLLNNFINADEIKKDFQKVVEGNFMSAIEWIKNNNSLKRASSFQFVKKEKNLKDIGDLIFKFLSYNNNMIGNIAGGFKHIQNASEYAEFDMSEFKKPKDYDDQIGNYRELLSELTNFRFFLGRVEYMQNLLLLQKEERISKENFDELNSCIINCQDIICDLINDLERIKKSLELHEENLTAIVDTFSSNLQDEIVLEGQTSAKFETRAGWYISADIGVAWAPYIKEVFRYVGVNFYFRPVNKDAPLRLLCKFKDLNGDSLYKTTFWHRISAMVGISTPSLALEGRRDNLFSSNSLLVGGGYRWTDSIRSSVGLVIFKALNPNPLIVNKKIKTTLFLSISLDWDVRSTLGGLLKLIGGEK